MSCKFRTLKDADCTKYFCNAIFGECQFDNEEYQGEHCPIYYAFKNLNADGTIPAKSDGE